MRQKKVKNLKLDFLCFPRIRGKKPGISSKHGSTLVSFGGHTWVGQIRFISFSTDVMVNGETAQISSHLCPMKSVIHLDGRWTGVKIPGSEVEISEMTRPGPPLCFFFSPTGCPLRLGLYYVCFLLLLLLLVYYILCLIM